VLFRRVAALKNSVIESIIIADEMGLGKTIQAIGTAELMRKHQFISSALIICPTSLKYQWKKEIERFMKRLQDFNIIAHTVVRHYLIKFFRSI